MNRLENRNKETEKPEIKPRNQILQTPETMTSESKGKLSNLDKYQNKPDAEKQHLQKKQKEIAEKYNKLDKPNKPNEGDTTKGQKIREKGHERQTE